MRISAIRPLVLGTPWRNLTFVVVETDEGLQGVGEVRMINHTDALQGYLHEAGRQRGLTTELPKSPVVQVDHRRDVLNLEPRPLGRLYDREHRSCAIGEAILKRKQDWIQRLIPAEP